MNYYTDFAAIPTGVYGVVYCDPPWEYQDKALAGQRGAGCKYDLMNDADLCALPVPALCAPDCICFMWCTMPKLAEGLALMAAWGFAYRTVAFTWVKRTKHDKMFWGMGRWSRANPELVLLGVKGKPQRMDAGVHSVIEAKIAEHSRKPQECRDRIIRLMGNTVPKIELFGRGSQPNWDTFGNTPEFASVA